jgi:hypothetical protein
VSRRDGVVCVQKMVTGGGTVSPAGVPGPGLIANNAAGCVTTATPTPVPDTAGLPPQRRTSEKRRVSQISARTGYPPQYCYVTFCVGKESNRVCFCPISTTLTDFITSKRPVVNCCLLQS